MTKIAKAEYYTMVKNASLSNDECVLAQHSQHINPPAMAETNHVAPELVPQKSRLKPLPKPPSSTVWKIKHKTTYKPSSSGRKYANPSHITIYLRKSSFSFCLCKGRNTYTNRKKQTSLAKQCISNLPQPKETVKNKHLTLVLHTKTTQKTPQQKTVIMYDDRTGESGYEFSRIHAYLVNKNFVKDLYHLYLGNLNVHKSPKILVFTKHYKGISSKICEFPVTCF